MEKALTAQKSPATLPVAFARPAVYTQVVQYFLTYTTVSHDDRMTSGENHLTFFPASSARTYTHISSSELPAFTTVDEMAAFSAH